MRSKRPDAAVAPGPFHGLKVGARVFWVREHYPGEWVKVIDIGERWVQLGNGARFDINTGESDPELWGTGLNNGTCYASRAAYKEAMKLRTEWMHFREEIFATYRPPRLLTRERLRQIEATIKSYDRI